MLLLDTDHVTVLQRRTGSEFVCSISGMHSDTDVFELDVSFEQSAAGTTSRSTKSSAIVSRPSDSVNLASSQCSADGNDLAAVQRSVTYADESALARWTSESRPSRSPTIDAAHG